MKHTFDFGNEKNEKAFVERYVFYTNNQVEASKMEDKLADVFRYGILTIEIKSEI